MAQPGRTIFRKINYDTAGGAKANLIGKQYDIGGAATFTIQVDLAALDVTSDFKLYLQVSNDGTKFAVTGDEIHIAGLTQTTVMFIPANPAGVAGCVYTRIGVKDVVVGIGTIVSSLFAVD